MVKVKNMTTGDQQTLTPEAAVALIQQNKAELAQQKPIQEKQA